MWHLKKLNSILKYFYLLLLLVSASMAFADTKWEVAVVFQGAESDEAFQQDIDNNILELARLVPNKSLRLGIYREFTNGSYRYYPNTSAIKNTLSDLLYRQDLKHIAIPGSLFKSNQNQLEDFLKSFYHDKNSKKALVIFSHGKGAVGLNQLPTKELQELLADNVPHLDLLWFDACFMANVEFLYELRNISDYTLASEEAEFTSGIPFQTLSILPQFSSPKEAGIMLAKNFIESYSYLRNGQQRNYVSVSSATISLVDNTKLASLGTDLQKVSGIINTLDNKTRSELIQTLTKKATMDNKELVDLGLLLVELRKKTKSNDSELTQLIRKLNIESVKSLRTNPRLHIHTPQNKALIVYGFNEWQIGDKDDFEKTNLFASLLKNDGFIPGPHRAQWPYQTLQTDKLVITPFAPGLNTFNYYFLDEDGKLLSSAQSVSRTHDLVESLADSSSSPLIYSAYTQQIGTKAERYTGLNITMPGSVASIDYFELDFNQLAHWLSL